VKLDALSAREASMFACLVDATVAPDGAMAAVGGTDAVTFFDGYVRDAPAINGVAMRALLYVLELAPVALGYGRRLRRLPREQRAGYLDRLQRGPLALAAEPMLAIAKLGYYGDDVVMRELGYDADAVVARGRELRRDEARW
jgi:hypothetical protein